MVLLTDGPYDGSLTDPLAGLASSVNASANPNHGYAIVEIEHGASGVFAHEVGHLLGCGHQVGFYAPSGNNKAHTWTENPISNPISRRTISAAPATGSIAYFSNPSVSFNGNSTGLTNANNANMVNNNICDVSLFSEGFSPFNVFISGPSYIYNSNNNFTWCPLSNGCSALSNYFWPST